MAMTSKKAVVIVGGGAAGARLALELSEQLSPFNYELLLISTHPFYVHYPAALRALVTAEGALENRIFMTYGKLFAKGNGKFKQGTVTTIKAKRGSKRGGRVILESGETINYDVLVLASGSRLENILNFPSDKEKAHAHIHEWRKKFQEANSIVIAGGGAVGVELAGEIRDFHPCTKVTMVHGGRKLLNATYPSKFRSDVEKRIRARGVNLILNDYVDKFPAVATRKGVQLEADLFVPVRGPRPNTKFIAHSLGSDTLNNGYVRILPTMQLESYPSIFAMGDIIDYPEQKQVTKCPAHAAVIAPNILSLLENSDIMQEYKNTLEVILITNGRKGGAGYANIFWGLMFGNAFTAVLKSKDLLIEKTRKLCSLE